MNPADQIEAVARATTAAVAAASREFTATQRRLSGQLDADRAARRNDVEQLRADLESAADAADNATPRILLPADVAEASPHRSSTDE